MIRAVGPGNHDGDVTDDIIVTSDVDIFTAGTYSGLYEVTDSSGNYASATRTVEIYPPGCPLLHLLDIHRAAVRI